MILIDVLTSPRIFLIRAVIASISIASIWRGVKMEYIMYTPAEFLPWLVLIGIFIPLVFTVVKSRVAYQDTVKKNLRSGKWKSAPAFGMDYMAANIGVVIIGAVSTVLGPGLAYAAIDAVPSMAGCLVIGLGIALVIGIKGPTCMSEVVDMFRNPLKIKEEVKAAEAEIEDDNGIQSFN